MITRNRIKAPGRYTGKTLVILGTLFLLACGDSSTGPNTGNSPQGEFTLNTIESKALPYMMYSDTGYTLEITSGSLSIKSDGKWVSKITSRETVDGFVSTYSDSTFGTWTQSSGTMALLNTESSVTSNATWTSTDVTVTEVDGTVSRKISYRRN
jgi:hypothetical protein